MFLFCSSAFFLPQFSTSRFCFEFHRLLNYVGNKIAIVWSVASIKCLLVLFIPIKEREAGTWDCVLYTTRVEADQLRNTVEYATCLIYDFC